MASTSSVVPTTSSIIFTASSSKAMSSAASSSQSQLPSSQGKQPNSQEGSLFTPQGLRRSSRIQVQSAKKISPPKLKTKPRSPLKKSVSKKIAEIATSKAAIGKENDHSRRQKLEEDEHAKKIRSYRLDLVSVSTSSVYSSTLLPSSRTLSRFSQLSGTASPSAALRSRSFSESAATTFSDRRPFHGRKKDGVSVLGNDSSLHFAKLPAATSGLFPSTAERINEVLDEILGNLSIHDDDPPLPKMSAPPEDLGEGNNADQPKSNSSETTTEMPANGKQQPLPPFQLSDYYWRYFEDQEKKQTAIGAERTLYQMKCLRDLTDSEEQQWNTYLDTVLPTLVAAAADNVPQYSRLTKAWPHVIEQPMLAMHYSRFADRQAKEKAISLEACSLRLRYSTDLEVLSIFRYVQRLDSVLPAFEGETERNGIDVVDLATRLVPIINEVPYLSFQQLSNLLNGKSAFTFVSANWKSAISVRTNATATPPTRSSASQVAQGSMTPASDHVIQDAGGQSSQRSGDWKAASSDVGLQQQGTSVVTEAVATKTRDTTPARRSKAKAVEPTENQYAKPPYVTTAARRSHRVAEANQESQGSAKAAKPVLRAIAADAWHAEAQDALFKYCLTLRDWSDQEIRDFLSAAGKLQCVELMLEESGVSLQVLLERMCEARTTDQMAYIRAVQTAESIPEDGKTLDLALQHAIKVIRQYALEMRSFNEKQIEAFLSAKKHISVIVAARAAFMPLVTLRDNVLRNEGIEQQRQSLGPIAERVKAPGFNLRGVLPTPAVTVSGAAAAVAGGGSDEGGGEVYVPTDKAYKIMKSVTVFSAEPEILTLEAFLTDFEDHAQLLELSEAGKVFFLDRKLGKKPKKIVLRLPDRDRKSWEAAVDALRRYYRSDEILRPWQVKLRTRQRNDGTNGGKAESIREWGAEVYERYLKANPTWRPGTQDVPLIAKFLEGVPLDTRMLLLCAKCETFDACYKLAIDLENQVEILRSYGAIPRAITPRANNDNHNANRRTNNSDRSRQRFWRNGNSNGWVYQRRNHGNGNGSRQFWFSSANETSAAQQRAHKANEPSHPRTLFGDFPNSQSDHALAGCVEHHRAGLPLSQKPPRKTPSTHMLRCAGKNSGELGGTAEAKVATIITEAEYHAQRENLQANLSSLCPLSDDGAVTKDLGLVSHAVVYDGW